MTKLVRKIGLVAHDAMKKDLIEWVLWNSELLMGHKFYCTGTTGTLILEALKEKHPDVEWDFTILKSGPLGGDQQMGSRIVDGEIDYLFFFTDPMTLQPHDTDVKALTRLAGVENIVFAVTVVRQTILFQARYSLIRRMNALFRITPAIPNDLKINRWLPRQWSLQKTEEKERIKETVGSPIRLKRGEELHIGKSFPFFYMKLRMLITKIQTIYPLYSLQSLF